MILNPSSLADVVQAINHGLFIDGSHPLAASEMSATSQAADAENGADALHGPLGRNPSAQRLSKLLCHFLQLLAGACFATGIGTGYCSMNSLNAVQKTCPRQL